MKIKDRIILALLLVLFTTAIGFAGYGVHYLLDSNATIKFDLVTRLGVDSMAGEGLDGDDTTLWLDMSAIDTGVQLITVTHPIQKTGTEDQPDISFADTYTYTQAEITAYLLDKADTPHAHDDRYYTETEEDTWRNGTTQTEMGYVHGVTSDIQDQLDAGGGGVQTVTAGGNMTNSGTEADPVLDVYLETEVPLTPVTAGTTGDMKTDSNYLYVCISTNVWKRAELSSWTTTPISIITNDGYYLTNSDGYSLITY